MVPNLLTELAKELERALPLIRSLADIDSKEQAAQEKLKVTLQALARAEREAAHARQSADQTIATTKAECEAKTDSFKRDLVARHADATRDYDALLVKAKAEKLRQAEELRTHKTMTEELRAAQAAAQHDLDEITRRLVSAKAEFAKALAGVA